MKVALLDDWHHLMATFPCYSSLAGHEVSIWHDHVEDVDLLAERLKDAEALGLYRDRTPIPGTLVERLPRLRMISVRGRISSNLDVAACTRHGVVVSALQSEAVPDGSTVELAVTLMLMGMRELPRQIDSMKAGKWQSGVGRVLRGQTLGIYAYGRIGSQVAALGRAFGMQVQVWGRGASLELARAEGFEAARSREAFFSESDVVTMHMPLVDSSRGIVTEADLLLMKPTAMFVNTSRAGLVAPGALLSALQQGRPGKAGLDVYDQEPVTDANHPLLQMPNVICTPHIGAADMNHIERNFKDVFAQIQAYGAGSPINVLNPEVLKQR